MTLFDLWVDGSYSSSTKLAGWAYVIHSNGAEVGSNSGSIFDPEIIKSRQVGAELRAVIEGLNSSVIPKGASVTIYYDYEGIESWITSKWSARTSLTQKYIKNFKK